MRKVGILGGTFDPPHLGHLIIAEEVKNVLELDEIWFLPAYEPPHKNEATADVQNRIQMLTLALKGNSTFKIHPLEINRKGKSYTIDTMKIFKEQYPDLDFYFIIGADMVEYLPHWHKIDELVQLVTFVGVKRIGYTLETTYDILTVDIPMVDISSSMIRKRIKEKKSIKYLVPEDVERFIKEKGLYGDINDY